MIALGERPATFAWASVRRDFSPSRHRVQNAAKLALSCTLTMVLAYTFNWPNPSVAIFPPLILNRADVRYDVPQVLWAGVWTAVMGSFYYWSLNFSQEPLWFALVVGGGLVVSGTLSRLPTIGPAISIGHVIPSVILASYFFSPEARADTFLPDTMELLLGYVVALVVGHLVWPYSPRREWDHRFHSAWVACRHHASQWFAGHEAGGTSEVRPGSLDSQLEELLNLLASRIQPADPLDEGPAVRAAATRLLEEIVILLQDLQRLGPGNLPVADPALFQRLGAVIDARLGRLEELLVAGRAVRCGESESSSDEDDLRTWLAAVPGDLRREDLRRLWETLGACPQTFHTLSRLPEWESVTRREQSLLWTLPVRWEDLRRLGLNEVHHGVKVACICLLALGLWQALRWPAGGTMIISALIIVLTSLGLSARQAINRVVGLLLGLLAALLSIMLVVRPVETIFGYGLCVFVVLGIFGYLAGGNPRLSYIGFQGAVTYVVVFVSGDLQSVNLEPLRQRFVALTFGVLIGVVVLRVLWPERRVKALFKTLADNFALCATAWSAQLQTPGEHWPAAQEAFMREFNLGLVQAAGLLNAVEFEGGEGSPRYGYAGRLVTHETALFEQVYLFGRDWTELGSAAPSLARRVRSIQGRFRILAHHFGQPVDGPAAEPSGGALPPSSPPASLSDNARQQILEQRAGEVEAILTSMERLTGSSASA